MRVIKKNDHKCFDHKAVIEMSVIKKNNHKCFDHKAVIEMSVIEKNNHKYFDHNTIVIHPKKMSAAYLKLRFSTNAG